MQFLSLPLLFFRFWYFDAPRSIGAYFFSVNRTFLQIFSLGLLVKTFFKPWKNEYRKGLIGFSRFMGMGIKSCVILVDLFLFTFLLLFEIGFFLVFVGLPIFSIGILIYA